MINGDLCSDIVGTNPTYPPIVDHSWLDVDLSKYDNYPSDNNPVRVVPKLHDIWQHSANQNGISLIPNSQVMPLGTRMADEDAKAVIQVVKEAKKAIMSGLKGKNLTGHLRARFAAKHIQAAAEDLKKIAEEIGLLGNVYIDASAFSSVHEAEQFLTQHRSRLARDILVNDEGLSQNVLGTLASTFHKNVVSSVTYDETLLNKYRSFLVQAKRIPDDMVIASKEDLRKAFLFVWPQKEVVAAAKAPEKKIDKAKMDEAWEKNAERQSIKAAEEQDSLLIPKVSPIIAFVQENLSKGKTASDIKGMIRTKYAMVDIKSAAEAIGVVLSKEGLSEENINGLVKNGSISFVLGQELKKIGKKFPMKKHAEFPGAVSVERPVGTQGYFYNLGGKKQADKNESYRQASVEALKKGFTMEAVKAKLQKKLSAEETNQVLSEAITLLNAIPAGAVANKAIKAQKVLVEEVAPKQTLPDPSTISSQINEYTSTFAGCSMDVDIDPVRDFNAVEVNELFNRDGLDETIK